MWEDLAGRQNLIEEFKKIFIDLFPNTAMAIKSMERKIRPIILVIHHAVF
jgi:hypothetical protein